LFEEKEISLNATQMLLVRICVGKIEKADPAKEILRNVPVRGGATGWNCVYWVAEALQLLADDPKVMGSSNLDWMTVRNCAMTYVEQKKFQGRFQSGGSFDYSKPPTYDMLSGQETIA
jgi:hypothetical protein